MDPSNLDYMIVIVFLLITLIIGIISGRNTKTLQEYALANRTFGTTALVLTYLATDIGGGSIFSDASSIFERGIIVYVSITSLVIAFVIRAFFIAPNMIYFPTYLTIGEVIGNLYGTLARIFTGILGFLNANVLAGIQLITLGIICEDLLNIKAEYGIIVGSILMTCYAAWGGIRSITATDIFHFQFLVLITFIPLVAIIALKQVGGLQELFHKLPRDKLTIISHKKFYCYLTYFVTWIFQLGMIDPAIIQRMLMAKNKSSLVKNEDMIVSIIVATSSNGVIGQNNKLPWHMPADLLHFKQLTLGHHILMGSNTFRSIGRILPNRTSIVVSTTMDASALDYKVVRNIQEGIALAKTSGEKELFIIGGGMIYQQSLPLADKIYLTRIHVTLEGDTFFPPLQEEWKITSTLSYKADATNLYDWDLLVLEK